MMNKKNIGTGLFFILIAVVMMGSAMGLIPKIPWFKLLCCGALGIWAVKALFKRDFFGTFMSAGLIAWIFEDELMIEHLAPFPLLAATALIGIGLNMIFGKKAVVQINYEDGKVNAATMDDLRTEAWVEGRQISLVNNFNSTSKYVNETAFSSAKLVNDFGSANIYFNNANVYEGEAEIKLSNNFGKMNVYLPGKWRATISQESSFGNVNVHGEPNRDMDAPHVVIKASSNFGELNIFFD